MEDLVSNFTEDRYDFEIFKSNICHRVKDEGDFNFIIDILEKDDINCYFEKNGFLKLFIYWEC